MWDTLFWIGLWFAVAWVLTRLFEEVARISEAPHKATEALWKQLLQFSPPKAAASAAGTLAEVIGANVEAITVQLEALGRQLDLLQQRVQDLRSRLPKP